MDPRILTTLVYYIHRLYEGDISAGTFASCRGALQNCGPEEVNFAIDSLMIRRWDMDRIDSAVAKFIKAAGEGLNSRQPPSYDQDSYFALLSSENRWIDKTLKGLRHSFKELLPGLREQSAEAANRLCLELMKLGRAKTHYLKLQNGLFSRLEQLGSDTRCTALMWHLEDKALSLHRDVTNTLKPGLTLDFQAFNVLYGRMYALFATLVYREDRILFPVAAQKIPASEKRLLLQDALSAGILD